MTWQYIAGFFDGEGWIQKFPKPEHYVAKYAVGIGQSTKQARVLYTIADFLKAQSIESKIYTECFGGKVTQMTRLKICKAESVLLFLVNLLPLLQVKHEKAASAIEDLKRSVDRKRSRTARLSKATQLYLSGGMSYASIERQTKIDKRDVLKHLTLLSN